VFSNQFESIRTLLIHGEMMKKRYLYLNGSGTEKIEIGKGQIVKHIASREKIETFMKGMHLLPNPDKVLKRLGKRITVYKDMLYDHVIQRCVNKRVAGVKAREFTIEQNDAEKIHLRYIEDMFERLNIKMLLEQVLNARWWGYQPFELELFQRTSGGVIELNRVVDKPSEWFAFSLKGKLKLLSSYEGETLPSANFITAINRPSSENPYGWAEFSPVFWHTQFSKGGLKLFLAFTEKYGSPFLYGTYSEDATEEQKTDLFNALVEMVQDAVGIGPEGSSIQIIESASKGASADVFEKLIEICDKAKLINLVGQTLTTDLHGQGARAAVDSHHDVEDELIEGDIEFEEEFLSNLIKHMLDLNWSGITNYPKARLILKKEEDPDKLMERDAKAARECGIEWKKERFTEAHHIPEEHFEMTSSPEKEDAPKNSFSKSDDIPDDQQAINEMLNSFSSEEYNSQIENIIEPVIELVKESKSISEAKEKLHLAFPKMDSSVLEEVLTNLIFSAKIMGSQSDD